MSPVGLTVGLTGGIASGKSTVSHRLRERGAFVVDMDVVAHEALAPEGIAFGAVVERFGDRILDEAGQIDRGKLGPIVFADAEARADLERIVHPAVQAESRRRVATAFAGDAPPPFAVVDAALLVETGRWKEFDALIVVACRRETQRERLMARDGLSAEEANRRIAAQSSTFRKLALADYVIDSERPLEAMLDEVDRLFDTLSRRAARDAH